MILINLLPRRDLLLSCQLRETTQLRRTATVCTSRSIVVDDFLLRCVSVVTIEDSLFTGKCLADLARRIPEDEGRELTLRVSSGSSEVFDRLEILPHA